MTKKKLNEKYSKEINEAKEKYYQKFKNVKGFKQRFFRSTEYLKILKRQKSAIQRLEIKESIETLKKQVIKSGPIYKGDLFKLVKGGGSGIYSKILKRITKYKPFYFQKTEFDEDGNAVNVQRFTKMRDILDSLTRLINRTISLDSSEIFDTYVISEYEETNSELFITMDVYPSEPDI